MTTPAIDRVALVAQSDKAKIDWHIERAGTFTDGPYTHVVKYQTADQKETLPAASPGSWFWVAVSRPISDAEASEIANRHQAVLHRGSAHGRTTMSAVIEVHLVEITAPMSDKIAARRKAILA
jgi:hypothetical protein